MCHAIEIQKVWECNKKYSSSCTELARLERMDVALGGRGEERCARDAEEGWTSSSD